MFKTLLSKINQHSKTSIEKYVYCPFPCVSHYQDDRGRNRFVYSDKHSGQPICGLLTEQETKGLHTITALLTREGSRRKGYAKDLVAVAKITLKRIEHSTHLSNDGYAFFNR
jgi:hypothetical protein